MIEKLKDIELPDTLYKFRDWSNRYHRELIYKQIAFFASPASFNDPFDCKIPIRYDIKPEKQLENIYFNILRAGNPETSENTIRKFAQKYTIEGPVSPKSFKKNDSEYFAQLDKRIGIFSLTEHHDDILMWAHYANAHRGFCVGFNTSELLKTINVEYIGKVGYFSDFPLIVPKGSITDDFDMQIFSKWDRWAYEDEYRLTKNHISNRKIALPKKAFKEIILGYNMNSKNRKKIIRLVKKEYSDIEIFEATPHEAQFQIEINKIS